MVVWVDNRREVSIVEFGRERCVRYFFFLSRITGVILFWREESFFSRRGDGDEEKITQFDSPFFFLGNKAFRCAISIT